MNIDETQRVLSNPANFLASDVLFESIDLVALQQAKKEACNKKIDNQVSSPWRIVSCQLADDDRIELCLEAANTDQKSIDDTITESTRHRQVNLTCKLLDCDFCLKVKNIQEIRIRFDDLKTTLNFVCRKTKTDNY